MSTRACPYCGETIQTAAVKCRFCKEALDGSGGGGGGRGDDDDRPPPSSKGAGASVVVIIIVVALCAVLGFVAVVAAIAIPNLIEARKSGNESSAIGSLKAISTAQAMFQQGDKDNDQSYNYGTLAELGAPSCGALLDPNLASGSKTGYLFSIGLPPRGSPEFESLWAAEAQPLTPRTTGDRYFGVDQAGQIFYSTSAPFGVSGGRLVKPSDARVLGR